MVIDPHAPCALAHAAGDGDGAAAATGRAAIPAGDLLAPVELAILVNIAFVQDEPQLIAAPHALHGTTARSLMQGPTPLPGRPAP